MKVRLAKAAPCLKKGIDNKLSAPYCECREPCRAANSYEFINSKGSQKYLKDNPLFLFKSCTDVESYLIENQYIKYDSREQSGLDVLFNGIDKLRNLTSDHLELDCIGNEDITNQEMSIDDVINQAQAYFEDNDLFGEEKSEERPEYDLESSSDSRYEYNHVLEQKSDLDLMRISPLAAESIIASVAPLLGFNHSMAHDIFASAPESLVESIFNKLYYKNEFSEDDDMQAAAYIRYERHDDPRKLKKIWKKYTARRLKLQNKRIDKIIWKSTPSWFKRFKKAMGKLTDNQMEAIRSEYFHKEDEKPTQAQSARKLKISVSSYQERLEWAYLKFEDIYPELERVCRRKTKKKKLINGPAPIYDICVTSGKRSLSWLPLGYNDKMNSKDMY